MTIRRTLLLTLLLFSVLFAAAMTALAYTRSRAALDTEIRRQLATQAETLGREIAGALFERLQDIHGWQGLDVLQELKVGDVDKRLARHLHEIALAYDGLYTDISCVRGGRVVAASDAALIGSPFAPAPDWRAIDYQGDRVWISRPYAGARGPVMEIRLAVPDAFGGGALGELVARYDWAEVEDALARVAGHGREALLLDDAGGVLAGKPAPGGRVALTMPPARSDAAVTVGLVDGRSAGGERALVGRAQVGAYRALPDLGWSVTVLTPEKQAFAPVRKLLWSLLAALAAIAAVAAVLAIALSTRVAGPIQALTRYTRELAGDLELPTRTIGGSSEIGELCAAFNRLLADLRRSRVHLVRASKLAAVGEMAAKLAHEVRTPLGIIRSSAELVNRQPGLDDTGHEMMSFMINECDRMNALVTGLLESARPRDPVLEPLMPDELLRQVAEMLRERAGGRRVSLELALAAPEATIAGDRGQMLQVLLNLVVNALQVSPPGGRVVLSSEAVGDELVLAVDDEGPGIAAARREAILEPFVSDRPGGIGLGLSIVREIVTLHRGRLGIDDSPLGGARFTIHLPLAPRPGTPS